MAEVRPAQEWLFVAPETEATGAIHSVGIGADICRVGNQVEFEDERPIRVPHIGVVAIREESITKEVEV